jgi:hydrogenase nickel incorporation protein HypA/HybF
MHELGIATSLLQQVRTEMQRRPNAFPCRVGVRIGEMAAIDQDALRFAFDSMTRGTDLQSLELRIESCPLRNRCQACGRDFVVYNYESRCPQCGSLETVFAAGDELELAYLEVESGTNSARTKSAQ